jgi:hypothetical protein
MQGGQTGVAECAQGAGSPGVPEDISRRPPSATVIFARRKLKSRHLLMSVADTDDYTAAASTEVVFNPA